jgi:hypothetical protein
MRSRANSLEMQAVDSARVANEGLLADAGVHELALAAQPSHELHFQPPKTRDPPPAGELRGVQG